MAPRPNIIERLLRTEPVRSRIQRSIVERAARTLAPEQQSFEPGAPDFGRPGTTEPLAAYVHFPFCASACRYCIFKKTLDTGLIEQYTEALLAEIDRWSREPALEGRRIASLYLGGGTPSLVHPRSIEQLLRRLDDRIGFEARCQITIEGNPESLTADRAREYLAAGVDRFSLGVQSLDDRLLGEMGRNHTGAGARRAIEQLQRVGAANLNVDLIYGFDGQSTSGFLVDVRTLVELGVPHLSAFPLIERGVRQSAGRERRRKDARQRATYRALVEELAAAGYQRYSSEDFALAPRHECRYQVDAWRFPRRDVLGIGAGSLGSLGRRFYSNRPDLEGHFAAIERDELPIARWKRIGTREEHRRSVLLGAKYLHVSRGAFLERYGVQLEPALEPLLSRLRRLGVWTVGGEGIDVTESGLQIVTAIWSELILANLAAAGRSTKKRPAAA